MPDLQGSQILSPAG